MAIGKNAAKELPFAYPFAWNPFGSPQAGWIRVSIFFTQAAEEEKSKN